MGWNLNEQGLAELTQDLAVDADIFDLAPVSLWLQDFSALRSLFAGWRAAGVESLAAYFAEDYTRVMDCVKCVRILKVNQKTVELYGASSDADLLGCLADFISDDDLPSVGYEFIQLWEGHLRFVRQTINRSVTGRLLDVLVTGTVLPGHEQTLDRVLVAVQDLTAQEASRRDLAKSETYARGLFDYSPISLWVEDFSAIKHLLDGLRGGETIDFREFILSHDDFVLRCLKAIRIIDFNEQTLQLFRASDRATLLGRLDEVLRDKVLPDFKDQLVDLWNGKLQQEREITSYALGGEELNLHMRLSVFPGHEQDWSLVLVALTDISARKKAEAYLEYLGTHDELTKLLNRAFYVAEIERLQCMHQFPLSVITIDLNGLKRVNDEQGHMVGDDMLRRLANVLDRTVRPPGHACRVGGDEFTILLPRCDTAAAEAVLEEIRMLLCVINQRHAKASIEVAAGVATATSGERIDDAIRLADQRMYDDKSRFYRARGAQRRLGARAGRNENDRDCTA